MSSRNPQADAFDLSSPEIPYVANGIPSEFLNPKPTISHQDDESATRHEIVDSRAF
jgi:hypothetical protein